LKILKKFTYRRRMGIVSICVPGRGFIGEHGTIIYGYTNCLPFARHR
jgi:hypothetical protein